MNKGLNDRQGITKLFSFHSECDLTLLAVACRRRACADTEIDSVSVDLH